MQDKVAQFLKWAAEFAKEAGKKSAQQIAKILAFIKNNPGKIVDWFSKGYTAYEILKMILGS
ncbi:AMEP412 family response elicitor [Aneurinibacillus migulanus]|uniref:AMEP412 family response elicitor n=1 Tax=Aneurinibacillus migulanus TaxID=47500 RepID=UPI002E207CA7|nr:AMEP412 family response elicitor [Aneurinibacillus migulanus]